MSDEIEIGFIERDLRALDAATGEIVVTPIYEDERPPGGALSLLDWRMNGRLSRHLLGGFLTGARGERFLVPGRPRIGFDKILMIGMGPREGDEAAARETLEVMIDALAKLEVRRAAIELPGRHRGVVAPVRALEILGSVLAGRASSLETVSVIDDREMSRAVENRITPGRRARGARR